MTTAFAVVEPLGAEAAVEVLTVLRGQEKQRAADVGAIFIVSFESRDAADKFAREERVRRAFAALLHDTELMSQEGVEDRTLRAA